MYKIDKFMNIFKSRDASIYKRKVLSNDIHGSYMRQSYIAGGRVICLSLPLSLSPSLQISFLEIDTAAYGSNIFEE
jgi:hypothetical protein